MSKELPENTGLTSWPVRLFLVVALCFPLLQVKAATDRVVVLISVDGLAGFYLDDPQADIPNLRALAAGGARSAAMLASTPTVTWPNHTTLVTGVTPARHGVVGNNYFNRSTGKRVTLIADPVFDKDQIVKVPTIYDVAKANGLVTAALRWPATRNAKTLDWTIPDIGSPQLREKYSTPSLWAECERTGLSVNKAKTADGEPGFTDRMDGTFTQIFNRVLREHRPQLALLHLLNVDHAQHLYGPRSPEAYAAIKGADHCVGLVWEELKRDFPERAALFVVSDHGFSPIEKIILPNVILKNEAISTQTGTKNPGDVFALAQGGSAFIYIRNEARREALETKLRRVFADTEGVARVIGTDQFAAYGVADPRQDPHAPDLILFAELGYAFGNTAAGALPFQDKPERRGTHGHDPHLPELHATFVAWGAGIKPGVQLAEISNLDVAPTIASLLGVDFPADGKVLTTVLTN